MNKNSRGQGLVEFALILPLLLVVLFGVFDLGRIYFSTITLTSAAREGARYLTVYPGDVNSSSPYTNTVNIAIQEAWNSGILLTSKEVDVFCTNSVDDNECVGGQPAIVTVRHDFELILGWLLPSPITITRTAQMVVP